MKVIIVFWLVILTASISYSKTCEEEKCTGLVLGQLLDCLNDCKNSRTTCEKKLCDDLSDALRASCIDACKYDEEYSPKPNKSWTITDYIKIIVFFSLVNAIVIYVIYMVVMIIRFSATPDYYKELDESLPRGLKRIYVSKSNLVLIISLMSIWLLFQLTEVYFNRENLFYNLFWYREYDECWLAALVFHLLSFFCFGILIHRTYKIYQASSKVSRR